MDDLDSRLRRHLATVDRAAVPDPASVWRAAARSERRLRARRRAGALGGSLVLLVIAVVAVWSGRDEPDRSATGATATPPALSVSAGTEPTPGTAPSTTEPIADSLPTTTATTAEPVSAVDDAWRSISPDPRGEVYFPSVVWTGTEVIVFAGHDLDGTPVPGASAYSPTSDTWRVLADPAIVADTLDPLVAWTGRQVLAIGGTGPGGELRVSSGAAYDPASDEWTRLASPPIGFVTARSPWVWTGSRLLVWPGDGGGLTMDVAPIAYDPATDTWTTLPTPPVVGRQSAASVWSGSEWIVWGGTTGTGELDDGAAFDPSSGTWRVLARSPLTERRVRAVWTGSEMIVDAGSTGGDRATGNGEMALADGAAYDPASDTWRALSAGLAHPGFVPIWTGRHVVMFAKGSAVVYDVAADTWIDTCCSGGGGAGTPVWTGTVVVVIGPGENDSGGAIFTPPA